MPDIAPFLFERAETAPTVPPEGRFLIPLCMTEEELHILLGAAFFYAEHSSEKEIRHLIPLMQAAEYIGQVEYAECMGFFEDQNEDDCVNYKPNAPFIQYEPTNPYNEGFEVIPDGYLTPPFGRGDTPMYPTYLGFQATDLMVRGDAIPVFTDIGDMLGLHFPTIKLRVRGHGQIEIDFISVLLGGYAIVKVGSAPNIFDILDGIVDTGATTVDIGQDTIAIPPESDLIVAEEINVESEDFTDVYIVFVPKIDASTEFFGMGGGIRTIGLCGLETDAIVAGVEDVRFDETTYFLQKKVAGEWVNIVGADILFAWIAGISDTASRADGVAYSLREATSYDDGIERGFPGSPLKAYIDAAAGEEFDPSALEAAIAAAQATANGAVAVNTAQAASITAIQAMNTTQNTRLTNLESDMATVQADIAIAQADIIDIANKVNILNFGSNWALYHDFTLAGIYTASIGVWVSGFGWNSDDKYLIMDYTLLSPRRNQITHIEATLTSATSNPDIEWTVDGSNWYRIQQTGVGNILKSWLRVPNMGSNDLVFTVRFRCATGSFTVRGLRYLGRGDAIPFA